MLVLDQNCFCGEFLQLGGKNKVGKSNKMFFGIFLKNPYLGKKKPKNHQN
jgi:hypothetical protein